MRLSAGTRLGSYEILSPLGAGGMGEVYRANDTKLHRDVALKILPDAFATDPDRLARFTREAQTLASLNHPNIAAIYGLEEAVGVKAIVIELVEGEDLAQLIARGPLAVDDALPIARQIADALEAAHEKGIIHRDLKPANIKVRPDGTVKVLDYGLAKAMEPADTAPRDVSHSPTLTTPANMTGAGVVLGTAPYMSPEQAKGRAADKRSDVWAFGCVLYEMLTGARAFGGEDVNETIAAVLRDRPDWEALPIATPAPVRTLLVRALDKDRAKRLADITVAQFLLSESHLGTPGELKIAAAPRTMSRRVVGLVAASLLVGVAGAATAMWLAIRVAPPLGRTVTRFRVALPSGTALMNPNTNPDLAFSPDGSRLVYVGLTEAGRQQMYVQSIDQLDPTPVPGSYRGNHPFFSPDGKWIGLVSEDSKTLMKVPAVGGAAVKICTVTGAGGATWLPDGSIVFSQREPGLWRVPASGGTPVALTTPDGTTEIAHRAPEVLPGGKAILFTITRTTNYDDAAVGLLRLDTREHVVLVQGGMDPHYLPSGHLVFSRAGTVLAVPFDLKALQVSGTPVPVIEGVYTNANLGFAQLAVSPTGSIAYLPLAQAMGNRSLVWVDRHGAVKSLPTAPPQGYEFPRLSPDASQLAVSITGGPNSARRDIWVYEFARGTLSRLTSEKGEAETPVWAPDGSRVTYAVDRTEAGRVTRELMSRRADRSGEEESLGKSDHHLHLSAWSPRGDSLISVATDVRGIWILRAADKAAIGPLFPATFQTRAPSISPDGRWLAYASDETSRFEVYVQAFPGPGPKYPVSRDGGTEPTWNKRNGREIFFRDGDKMMAASVAGKGDALELGTPTTLFEGRFVTVTNPSGDAWYDVSPDGQRFLMLKGNDTNSVTVVQNWSEELKTRVPTK